MSDQTRSGYTAENDRRLAEYLKGLPESDLEELGLQVLHNLNVNENTRAALVHQAAMIRREKVARMRQTVSEGGGIMSEHDDYIATRPLSWWREYMKGAIGIYEGMAKHPVTKSEKRALFARLKYNYVILGGVGSYTALAIMEHAFPRNEVNS